MPPTFNADRFDLAWVRYIAAATRAHAPFPTYLAEGAALSDIESVEAEIGCLLPDDLRHLLQLHNGSREYQVLPGWELFSVDRLLDEWRVWEALYHTQFKPDGYDCKPVGPVRDDEWWRLSWIPFCGDGGGNHLCLDMEPATAGSVGQVITMWHDNPARELVATSLTEFVEMIADDFENGALCWDDEWGGVHASRD